MASRRVSGGCNNRGMRVVVVTALALGLALVAGANAAQQQASIRIVRVAPLTVRGEGFDAGQRVRLVATTGRARDRAVARATGTGTFTARFSMLFAVEPCHGTLVVAVTNPAGVRATTKRPCRPADPQLP